MYDRILVGIDGSENADRAVEYALTVGERSNAELYALFVVDTRQFSEPVLSSYELLIDAVEDEGHDLLSTFVERASERGLPVTTRCCHGVPNEELIDYAADIGADLLVLGYQGRTHTVPGRLGPVSDAVVHGTDRSVALV